MAVIPVSEHRVHTVTYLFFLNVVGNFLCLGDCHIDSSSEVFNGNKSHCGLSNINCNVSSLKQLRTTEISLEVDILLEEILTCGFGTLAIFTNNDIYMHIAEDIFIQLHSHSVLVVHYELTLSNLDAASERLEYLIWDSYHNKTVRNFAWIMGQPQIFVDVAQKIFQTHSRGYAAMLPHSMKLLIVCESSEVRTMEQQLSGILLDNIAVVIVHDVHTDTVQTLMWREHRQREMENITDSVLRIPMVEGVKTCKIFPNVNHGLNGRSLKMIAKEYLPTVGLMYKTPDPVSKELRYAGFIVDVIEAMAQTLNFTYFFIPEPGEDENITWDDFLDIMGRGDVDLGATIYFTNTAGHYNHTVTEPILELNLSGVYVNRDTHLHIGLLSFIDMEVYLCFSVCLLVTMSAFICLTFCSKRIEHCTNYSDSHFKLHLSAKKAESRKVANFEDMSLGGGIEMTECISNSRNKLAPPPLLTRKRTKAGTKTSTTCSDNENGTENSKPLSKRESLECGEKTHPKEKFLSSENIVDLFFRFIGSVLMQGILPGPRSWSVRVLLFFWWIMLLAAAAVVTARFTASLIKSHEEVPFTTFDELFAKKDYRWGTESTNTLIPVMRNAPKGSTLRKIIDGVDKFALDDPSVLSDDIQVIVHKLQSQKFVAILMDIVIEHLKNVGSMPEHVMMSEVILTSSGGMAVPKQSQLEGVFSKQISIMRDTGILAFYRNKHRPAQVRSKGENHEADKRKWAYIRALGFVTGTGGGGSLVILIVEFLYYRFVESGIAMTIRMWWLGCLQK